MASQKSILITGCSSGIGYACAQGMKKRGWRVFATARKQEDIQRLSDEGLEALYLDYTDEKSVLGASSEVLEKTGGTLDALFNNGAYGQLGAVDDLTTDVLRAQFEANFFGLHTLSRSVVPAMREHGGGRIVQCSSVLGFISMKHRAAYSSTKFALEALSTAMRLELAPWNIHVSTIQPGPISTRFIENAIAKIHENIDMEGSAHREDYKKRLEWLGKGDATSRFKLPPEAVFKKLVHAVESNNPKPAYRVTVPTHLMAYLQRILPARAMDKILDKGS